jgi:hypothetical protein
MRSARIAWVTVAFTVLSLVAAPADAAKAARERAEAKRLSQQAQAGIATGMQPMATAAPTGSTRASGSSKPAAG